ncbi:hypothetical protein [Streptomyces uncialis]|uniref:Uncharacterized protein n=1 Tax=Streptomyces uncialis TaxID=1048205 RepID=A0A1Q4V0W8_9ACTN|nr:hypothetical protein [Streptomyces uncialis]OKH91464.1 hypothetical protein AB852_28300 [Streptomyces uncialis]
MKRTTTPDVITVDEQGRESTVFALKRSCNGCGQPLGDLLDRDLDADGHAVDVRAECPHCRPVAEAERAGCRTWLLTPRTIARVDDDIDQLRVFAKGYWQPGPDGKNRVVGLRIGDGPDRVVARWGDWIIRHPDGRWSVHKAPTGAAS